MPANRLSILAKYRDQQRIAEARGVVSRPETRTADECRRAITRSTSAPVLASFTCYATTTKGLDA
jgi:ABC-type ATPase involved in cell division